MLFDKTKSLINKLKQDILNFDFNNTSERKVLEANYFSAYKRKPVIWTKLSRSGSFGILFMTKRKKNKKMVIDEIRHEYGHTKQLKQLGIIKYVLCIVIPSYFQFGNDSEYYRRPWEITADVYGGVQSRKYPEAEKVGFEYLRMCRKKSIVRILLRR